MSQEDREYLYEEGSERMKIDEQMYEYRIKLCAGDHQTNFVKLMDHPFDPAFRQFVNQSG